MIRPGDRVGPYEVVAELGRGGAGVVLEARGPDGRAVAVKVLLGQSAGAKDRFRREARLQGGLGLADGFVPLLEQGDDPVRPYLVMPLLRGGTLRARVAPGGLPIADAVGIVRALAGAAGRAHAQGIVHRDLKPENVLFGDDGRPLIADLGLAKHWDSAAPGASQSVVLSRAGELRGTVSYAAPEQINDSRSVGPTADVWALGAILHELVTGTPAFAGETLVEVVARVLGEPPERLRALRPDAPPWLELVVRRALARDPGARPPDGAALASALEAGATVALARVGRITVGVAVASALLLVGGGGGAAAAVALRRARTQVASPAPSPDPAPTPGAIEPPPGDTLPLPDGSPRPPPARTATLTLEVALGGTAWTLGEYVHAMALTPDRRRAIVGRADGVVACADLATGELVWLQRLPRVGSKAPPEVIAVGVSPAGDLAFSGGYDGEVRAWDLARGLPRWRTPSLGDGVWAFAADPARGLLAVGRKGGVQLLDLASGRVVASLEGGPTDPRGVGWAQGGVLVAGGYDGVVCLWRDLRGHPVALGTQEVSSLEVSPDGGRVLTGGYDGRIVLWDLATRSALAEFTTAARTRCVAFTPDGRRGLSGGEDGQAHLWDLDARRELRTLGAPMSFVMGVGVSADGRGVITGWDSRLREVDLETGRELVDPVLHGEPVTGVAVLPRRRVASASRDSTLQVWSVEGTPRLEVRLVQPGGVQAFAASPDGSRGVTTSMDMVATLWDLEAGRSLAVLRGHGHWVISAAFDSTGSVVATGSADRSVRLWDATTGAALAVFQAPDEVSALALESPKRALVAAGASLVAFERGEPRPAVQAVPAPLRALIVPTERGVLIEGGDDGVVRLRSLGSSRREPRALPALGDRVLAVAATADGTLVATASTSGLVQLWDPDAGREVDRVDLGPTLDSPTRVALDARGALLVIGTARGQVLLYRRTPAR